MKKKLRREAERHFVLNVNCKEFYGVNRSEIMLISNEDAVKWEEFFKAYLNVIRSNKRCGLDVAYCNYNYCYFAPSSGTKCSDYDSDLKRKLAKQALRICKILEEQKIDNLTEGITTGEAWQCPTCGAEKEPTVEVGDYFEWTEKSNVDNVNLSPCQFRKSAELVSLRSDFYWPLDEDDILNKIKSGELRKLKKGEVIRIEVK